MQPGTQPPQRRIKQRRQRSGGEAVAHLLSRILRNITDRPWRSVSIAFAVAIGVGIAIAIIAASTGIEQKVNTLLTGNGTNNSDASLKAAGVDIDTIHNVLIQTRDLLTKLAIGFTAALVGLVTWVTMGQRRREIGIYKMQGTYRRDIMFELLGESLILCTLGGILGVILGYSMCSFIGAQLPLLPMTPSIDGVIVIFPSATLLSFAATAVIAAFFVRNSDVSVGL